MENNRLEDFKKARNSNRTRYVIYGVILLLFVSTTYYLMFNNAVNKIQTNERNVVIETQANMEKSYESRIDSLEDLVSGILKENEALIGKIETQNKAIEKIEAKPNSPVKPSNSGISVINVNEAKHKQEALKTRYTNKISLPKDFTYEVLLTNPKQSNNIRKALRTTIPNATPSLAKEVKFTPFYKSAYEIYYANDADLKIASKMQSDLRKKQIKAVIYKVKATTADNRVVLIH